MESSMKILITTDLYAIKTNGVVTSIKNLCEELDKKGHEIRILTFSEDARSHKEENVSYIRSMPFPVYPNARMPLTYRHALVKEIVDWCPDVIHSQCEFFSYEFALYISKKTGAPIVHTCHTMYEQYSKYLIPGKRLGRFVVRFFMKRRLKKVSAIIAPTKKVEETLRGYGIQKPISVIPSGINLEKHKEKMPEDVRREKRAALGYTDENLVLINLGRLGAEKRTDELIAFMKGAAEEHEHLRLLIVGDGPARAELEAETSRLELGAYVHFTGMVDPSEVHDYYQLGDVFVSASTSEAQGLTYIEASANSLPLLCREDPCVLDVIKPGESGYAYVDEEDFREKLRRIAADPEWRRSAGECSRKIADHFDKSSFGVAADKLYTEVVERRLAADEERLAKAAARGKK